MEVQALPIRDDVTPSPTQRLIISREAGIKAGITKAEMPETRKAG
jgi:hypothetical protein